MRIAAIAVWSGALGCGFHVGASPAGDDQVQQDAAFDGPIDGPIDAPIDAFVSAAPFALSGLHWLLPCTNNLGNNNCNCATGVIANSVVITGAPSQHWLVTAHVRGAMEAMGYNGGAQIVGAWYSGGVQNDLGNNYYKLAISSPPQTYWLNPGTPTSRRSFKYDYMVTFMIDGGATATYSTSGQDGLQWGNYDQASQPITFPGVTTTPSPYDGQFAQLDVITAIPQ